MVNIVTGTNLTTEKINNLFEKIKKSYRKKTKIQSPAFDNEPIHINTHFWKHLKFQKNRRERSLKDIHSRLISIDIMLHILKTSFYYQDYFKGKDKNNIIHYWTILAIYNDIRYCIVIRKIGKQGNRHLYSIIPNWKGYIPREEANRQYVLIK